MMAPFLSRSESTQHTSSVTPPYRENPNGRRLSADEANERVEQLKSQGMQEDHAVAEVMKRLQREE
jgi:hypothetical protein